MSSVLEVFTIFAKHEGKNLMNLSLKKTKSLAFLLLILTSTVMTLSFLSRVRAQTTITSISPTSGYVGMNVTLIANITTPNGQCQVLFDEVPRLSEVNATGNNLTASFVVPHTFEGVHNVTVVDLRAGENDTAPFTVLPLFSIGPAGLPSSPAQLQENATLTISVNITGGQSNYTYPEVKVQTPSGNLTYETVGINITTDVTGDFYHNLTYPTDFSTGANTNFTGEYTILFNETAVNQFFIGLTNSSEYHRGDDVDIEAVDYQPDQNVTVTISGVDVSYSVPPFNATVGSDGVVRTSWNVPYNVSIGSYSLNITSTPPLKSNGSESQIFRVPGFKTDIFTLNLANETVPNVFVKTYDNSTNTYSNATSGLDGSVSVMLERGDYSSETFFKEVGVGETNFTVNEEAPRNFTCQLTDAIINVIDAQNVNIPFVSISLAYNYTTNLGTPENRTGTESGETDITGALQTYSLLPNIPYTINASRYGEVFNQDNNTVYDLPAEAYANITVLCPTKTMHVNVTGAYDQPIQSARVTAQEIMGGVNYSNTTAADGTADLNCTFGRYAVKVYAGETLLNETAFDLFEDENETIKCQLYGLSVSVKVVDYFGQPIPNAKVTWQGNGLQNSSTTGSDGIATFSNIIGGSLQVAVCLPGQSQPCVVTTSYVESPTTTITIGIGDYVLLAGFLIETSQLTTAIIIVLAVVLVLLVEVYRRRRVATKKSSS
jgi:hypothetical protein